MNKPITDTSKPRSLLRGWHIKTGRDEGMRWFNDLCFYFGNKQGAPFIAFHLPLHKGWCSRTKLEQGGGWRIKGGWEYYQPAILTGRLFTNSSKWHMLPTYYIPAKLVDLWHRRKRSWRDAMKDDAKLAQPTEKDS